ncbi:hypothetical protein [Streptomyces sp. NPDC015414]
MDDTDEVCGDQEHETEEEPRAAAPHRGSAHRPNSDHERRVFDRLP